MIEGSRVRVSIVGVVVLALFSALFARLWYLQVAAGSSYAAAAQTNRVRIVPQPPPRGRILDDKGRVLVDNRVANAITVDRKLDPKRRALVVGRLAELLGVPVATIQKRLDDPRVSPYTPVPVAVGVPVDTLAYVSEHKPDFPGVNAEPLAARHYPYGPLIAHALGYVGEISADELRSRPRSNYELGDAIGKAGVEQAFESELRGRPGLAKLEIDSRGRVFRSLGTEKPEPGHDVQLTLDLDVQKLAEDSLAQGMAAAQGVQDTAVKDRYEKFKAPAGAAVVLDARDGSVVAMASNPSFDPSEFADGIPSERFQQLNDPANHFPLINRVIQGQYAPGSTFKLVTALAGLASGTLTPNTTVDDTGVYKISDGVFKNAGGFAYGRVALPRAITVSSDVYFYTLGGNLWRLERRGDPTGDAIQQMARSLGFGRPTGVALPGELKGRVPDAAWKKLAHQQRPDAFPFADWEPGDNVHLAVGQGDLVVTPLQLASAYLTFADNGTMFTPRLASQVLDANGQKVRDLPPLPAGQVPISDEGHGAILAGLKGAVADPNGTASAVFVGFPLADVSVAGKTGTAEVVGKQDTSLFVGITPAEADPGRPRYVVLAVVEEGGFGAETAAPIVRRIIEGLSGLPLSTVAVVPEPVTGN